MVLKFFSFLEIQTADIQWLTFQFSDPGPWFILYWKKALENAYKIAVQGSCQTSSGGILNIQLSQMCDTPKEFLLRGKRLFEV